VGHNRFGFEIGGKNVLFYVLFVYVETLCYKRLFIHLKIFEVLLIIALARKPQQETMSAC
jgi:hypothetical protein